jgi:hypothetical protein
VGSFLLRSIVGNTCGTAGQEANVSMLRFWVAERLGARLFSQVPVEPPRRRRLSARSRGIPLGYAARPSQDMGTD